MNNGFSATQQSPRTSIFFRWILPHNKAFAIHSLSLFLFLSRSSIAWDQPMFLFVQARIASQRRRARCPFLAIYIKYRFFSTFGKNIDESRTPMHESPPSPSSSPSSSPRMNLRLATSPGETGSSWFNERHHKGEKSLFSRLYPISRLHPSLHAPSAPQPPLSRLRIGPLSIAAVLLLNLPQTRLSTLSLYIVFDASFFSTLFPTVDVLSLDS